MNLNETWKNCLAMWEWKTENCGEVPARPKSVWLEKHGFGNILDDCFFCEYANENSDLSDDICEECPGCFVDLDFSCTDHTYHYAYEPLKFYKRLVELNKRRLQ